VCIYRQIPTMQRTYHLPQTKTTIFIAVRTSNMKQTYFLESYCCIYYLQSSFSSLSKGW
jgi:hypothetical protein